MNKFSSNSKFFLAPILLIAIVGCKPLGREQSELQTLDNFAGNKAFKPNKCGSASYAASVSQYDRKILASSMYKASVKASLAAVPAKLVEAYLGIGNGKIIVSDAAVKEQCANSMSAAEKGFFQEQGQSNFGVCLGRDKAGGPAILLGQDEAAIRHSLIRVFSYVFSDKLMRTVAQAKGSTPEETAALQAGAKIEQDYLTFLGREFLADAQTLKAKNLAKMQKFSAQSPVEFSRWVFSEALDSYHCELETYNSFALNFGQTFAAFTNKGGVLANAVHPKIQAYAVTFGDPKFSVSR